jgi:hypothetical protein
MIQPHPSKLRSARDEPPMSRLLFRNGDTRRFLSFISQMWLENPGRHLARTRRPQLRRSPC